MYEVELKYHVDEFESIRDRLLAMGAEEGQTAPQVDLYFNHPSRDFAQTHEAFRIRGDGDVNRLTYKGPRHLGPTKTRREIELAYESGSSARDAMTALLESLGFRPVAAIHKTRAEWTLRFSDQTVHVTCDEVGPLGRFVEIEAIVVEREGLPVAQRAVQSVAEELGLPAQALEQRSYLRMALERGLTHTLPTSTPSDPAPEPT